MNVKTQRLAPRKQTPLGWMLSPIKKGLVVDMQRNYFKYIIVLPVVVWMILFCYKPMYGVLIAFQDYMPGDDIFSEYTIWVGFENFERFFTASDTT